MQARWVVAPGDRERSSELSALWGVSPLTAQLLLNRGIADPEKGRRYLEPRLADLRRPDGEQPMSGFERAVGRLESALVASETVGVYGDYDVDGVTSCALLTLFLRDAGGRIVPRVARRDAGYGFGVDDVQAFQDAGCAVIVTCDLGTSDHDALAAARARKIDVIVVDHHQVPEREPDLLALLNPHQPGCRFPFKGLASVGVAFYLAAALRTRLRGRGRTDLPDPRELLDLVAVGTVADMAPLTDENRILVHAGLQRLARQSRPGLAALCAIAGLPDGVRRAADISLRLSPRLNAPGRLGAAQTSLDLLLAPDRARAEELAIACEDANKKRQDVQERVLGQALAEAEAQVRQGRAALVVAGEGWHPGVVGIIAAKLVDRFARPAFVIAFDGSIGRGSARTPQARGFNLHRGLTGCADLLVRYGGHAAAAGLTVEKARLPELSQRLEAAARASLAEEAALGQRELAVDAEVGLSEVDEPLASELQRLEPFGVGNPEPLFGCRDVLLEKSRVVGNPPGHLQVTLRDGMHARDGIGFNLAAEAPSSGSRVRAAFFPELDTFRGVTRLRVRLRALSSE
jgi:single-stranded-DNA-specific exonuclease